MPDRPPTPGRIALAARTRRDARVAFAAACAWLSDYAAAAVPTRGDSHMAPADYVEVIRRIKLGAQEGQFITVCLMLEEGATWDQVAQACSLPDTDAAKTIYMEKYRAWASGSRTPWTKQGTRPALPESVYGDADEQAARLDEWCAARGLSDGPVVPGLRAVTDGLY